MVDRTRLKEALKVPARPVAERGLEGLYALPLEVIDLRTAAARAVVEAPETWWCAEHDASAPFGSAFRGRCWLKEVDAKYGDHEGDCLMVRVFLVPAEEES